MTAEFMAADRHPWFTYGIDAMIAQACRPGPRADRRHAPAEAVSNIIGSSSDAPLFGSERVVSYWVPGSREQVRNLLSGTATAGGNLIAGALLARVAAAARPLTVLERAGAVRVQVPLGTAEYVLPRWNESSGASWLEEGGDAPELGLSVGTGSAVPKLCAARMLLSRRIRLQVLDPIEPLILLELQRSNESLMETAYFNGGGGKVPLGICQTTGTINVNFTYALPTWAEVTGMLSSYLAVHADYSRAAWFAHPSLMASLMATAKAAEFGGFIVDPGPQIAGRPLYASAAVPAGKLILMDPTRVALVFWDSPSLMIDPYTNDTSGAVQVIVHNATDLVLTDPGQVVIGTVAA